VRLIYEVSSQPQWPMEQTVMPDNPRPRSTVDAESQAPERQRDPVRRWTFIVGSFLLLLLALQIASDRTAPMTSIATVEGLVLPISSRVSGELLRVAVSDDQTVEAGALLAEIDPTPFRLAVEAAEAELERAGQSIGASTAEVAAAQANLAQEQAELANTSAQAERTLELVRRGVVPAAQADQVTAEVATGEAAVAAAEAGLRRAEEALGPAGEDNPQLREAQSSLETAQFNLSQTTLVAPVRGLITNLSLGPGETATPGQPLLSMIDLRGGWIIAWFRENQLGNLAEDDRAEVVLDLFPGQVWKARVVSFSAGINTVNQAAPPGGLVDTPPESTWLNEPQRFAVRLEFDPPDSLPYISRLGSQATVMVYTHDAAWLDPLWAFFMRVRALISYVY
jgi:multidrug resistance efflux pump